MIIDEKQIYENQRYWRKFKALFLIMIVGGGLGLGGLVAVLYAFHLDPDTISAVAEINHACIHCPDTHQITETSYASHEVAWSGVFYVAYLCVVGIFAGVMTDR